MRLSNQEIERIASKVYQKHVGDDVIENVSASDFTDSLGEDAIRIEILIKRGRVGHLKGDSLTDAAIELQDSLSAADEQRFAHPSFGEVGETFESSSEEDEAEYGEAEEDDASARS